MNRSEYSKGNLAVPYPDCAGCPVTHRFEMSLTTGMLALGQITEIAKIPADCRVVGITVDADDMDSATALAFDVGILSGEFGLDDAGRTIGAEFFAASAVGQAGGVAVPTLKTAYRTTASDKERGVGIKITTAAGTPVAGVLGITLSYVSG